MKKASATQPMDLYLDTIYRIQQYGTTSEQLLATMYLRARARNELLLEKIRSIQAKHKRAK